MTGTGLAIGLAAAERLETGGVTVDETSWRCTAMPSRGVGERGSGRGPHDGIEATTAQRTIGLAP
jgi:hypothetical protein